jgi:hypothetical protein
MDPALEADLAVLLEGPLDALLPAAAGAAPPP